MTTNNFPTTVELDVLRNVSSDRLQKAVNALADNKFTVTLTAHTDTEIRARIENGDGQEYRVLLAGSQVVCDCADATFRKETCKHAAALVLYAIREPREFQPVETTERPPDLRLGKVRRKGSFG